MPLTFNKVMFWTPRLLSCLFILFLMLFSLDIFESGLGFWGTILGLIMHNIPALILIAVLIVSWKHELVGVISFGLAGLLYIILLLINPKLEWYMLSWSIIISGPAFLISGLFLMGWYKKRKNVNNPKP